MVPLMVGVATLVALGLASLWAYWRFHYFFRDPEREIPSGSNVVAPADGTVVYAHQVEAGQLPISVKNGKAIRLEEITKAEVPRGRLWHIGIFMSLFDVHVNRIPVTGTIAFAQHHKHESLSMSWMGIRSILGLRPLYQDALHITENERYTILINGEFPVYVVQIADAYVNRISCCVGTGDEVSKGQRFGRIAMGSQVDLVFPDERGMRVAVKVGQHVKAGESIVAHYGAGSTA